MNIMEYNCWMSAYQERSLEELFLPCSHNSTTYRRAYAQPTVITQLLVPFGHPWDACQDQTLETQLRYGVRVIDLRLTSSDSGVVFTCHGFHCIELKEALHALEDFFQNDKVSRTETVVLRLNEGYSAIGGKKWKVNWSEVSRMLEESMLKVAYSEGWDSKPNLKQLAGKVVLDIPSSVATEFDQRIYRVLSQKSWHDKEFSTSTNNPEEITEKLDMWLHERCNYIENNMRDTGSGLVGRLFYLSTPCTPSVEDVVNSYNPIKRFNLKYKSLKDFQTSAWPLEQAYIEQQNLCGKLPALVIEMDFVTNDMLKFVIELNN